MTNRTRLDSLRLGERFTFNEDGVAFIHMGTSPSNPTEQMYRQEPPAYPITGYAPGAQMVISLDSPPPVPMDDAEYLRLLDRLDGGPTCDLETYRRAESLDPNFLWRIDRGHVHNLLDKAMERLYP